MRLTVRHGLDPDLRKQVRALRTLARAGKTRDDARKVAVEGQRLLVAIRTAPRVTTITIRKASR